MQSKKRTPRKKRMKTIKCSNSDDEIVCNDIKEVKNNIGSNIDLYINYGFQAVLNPGIIKENHNIKNNSPFDFNAICMFIKTVSDYEIICPICLDQPTVPVVTSCGHIYCWICILECIYRSETNRNCPCPICYMTLTIKNMRPLIFRIINSLKIGHNVSMNLCYINNEDISLIYDIDKYNIFNDMFELKKGFWLIMNNENFSCDLISRFINFPTQNQILINYFINLSELFKNERIEYVGQDIKIKCFDEMIKYINSVMVRIKKNFNIIHDIDTIIKHKIPLYQFINGYNVFLHPSNFNQLKQIYHQKNDFNLPKTIQGEIKEFIIGRVDKSNIDRYNFLSHLPLHTEFTFCMIKFISPSLPDLICDSKISIYNITNSSESDDESYVYMRESYEIPKQTLCEFSNNLTQQYQDDLITSFSELFPSLYPN